MFDPLGDAVAAAVAPARLAARAPMRTAPPIASATTRPMMAGAEADAAREAAEIAGRDEAAADAGEDRPTEAPRRASRSGNAGTTTSGNGPGRRTRASGREAPTDARDGGADDPATASTAPA